MKLTPFGKFLKLLLVGSFWTAMVVGALALGWKFVVQPIFGSNNEPTPNVTFVPTLANGQPSQPQTGTTPNVDSNGQPVVPTQVVQPQADGLYPIACRPGTTKTRLVGALDDYAGFYPAIVVYMTAPENPDYCLDLIPKWLGGPEYDLSEAQVEEKIKLGEFDFYFASNGALALWDAESGRVVWSTDQSAGADVIIARNDIANIDGNPLLTLNDALGQTVLTSCGSADHYFLSLAFQTAGFNLSDIRVQCTGDPVGDYLTGAGKVVTYWDPIIRDAMTPDSSVMVTTNKWRTISDYVVMSKQAYDNKEDAMFAFLKDYNAATEAFTVANLPNTANLLVSFTFKGQNMAGWLFIDPKDPVGSLTKLVDGVAFSTLDKNVIMFKTDFFGQNLVIDQLDKTHVVWQKAEVYNNADEGTTKVVNYDPKSFVSDKFVKMLSKSDAKNVDGDFSNTYVTDINEERPNMDDTTIFAMDELLSLKYKNIQFKTDEARQLVSGEREKLEAMLQPIADMLKASPDAVIVIRGGAGFYSTDADIMAKQNFFAYRRALYISEILTDKNGLNIPSNRIVIDPVSYLPDHTPGTVVDPLTGLSEEDTYKVVIIRVVSTSGFK